MSVDKGRTELEHVEDDDPDAPDEEDAPAPKRTARPAAKPTRAATVDDDGDGDDEDDEDAPAVPAGVRERVEAKLKGKDKGKDKGARPAGESEEEAPETDASSEPAPEGKGKPPVKPAEKTFTQAQLDQFVEARLARDRQARDKELQAATGKTLEQLRADTKERRVQELQLEKGLDEDTARDVAEKEAKVRDLEAKDQDASRERELTQRTRAYQDQRNAMLSDGKLHPTVRALADQFADEIDEFAGRGTEVPFEGAVTWVLGQKILSGELFEKLDAATEQRTLAAVVKRGKVAPETPTGAPANRITLTPIQKQVARRMGVTDERYAAQQSRQQTRKGRGR